MSLGRRTVRSRSSPYAVAYLEGTDKLPRRMECFKTFLESPKGETQHLFLVDMSGFVAGVASVTARYMDYVCARHGIEKQLMGQLVMSWERVQDAKRIG